MSNIDTEWMNFLDDVEDIPIANTEEQINDKRDMTVPIATDIYISTKTKIIYLNVDKLDIDSIFWKIPVTNYDDQSAGIIKKQMKIVCKTKEEVESVEKLIENESYYYSKIIKHIDNPDGRIIKFNHVRKVSVGLCKKDVIYTRTKEKSAFYNCFVVTLRILYNDVFKEIHVKVFNTGKLEIPGARNDEILNIVINNLLSIVSEVIDVKLSILEDKTENVLINSNFNCGYYINREVLFNTLRYKYKIHACYDPCSYPGIQCVYYYDSLNKVGISNTINYENCKKDKKDKNIQKISYMIFRTGSILIVGKCSEEVLRIVYEYVKTLLNTEYLEIMTSNIDRTIEKVKKPISKQRKKIIYVNNPESAEAQE
jgi:TATA-box binding protein (TBP) (component of TFIID and TFIIIB)